MNLASRGIITYYTAVGPIVPPRALFLENIVSWSVLYSSLILATLLWCTILIIYRILRVGGAAGRMHAYQRVIEMLVESAFLYSAVLVVLLVFEVRNEVAGIYIEDLAIATRVRLICFDFLLRHNCIFFLGNCTYNSGRSCCSRACTPRRLLDRKYSVVASFHSSSKRPR